MRQRAAPLPVPRPLSRPSSSARARGPDHARLTQLQASADRAVSGPVLQREPNPETRQATDVAMDGLKTRAVLVLGNLTQDAENWQKTWAGKGEELARDKATQVIDREEGPSLESRAAKEIWSCLSTEEKLEIVQQGASLGFQAFRELLGVSSGGSGERGGSGRGLSLPSSGGSARREDRAPREPSEPSESLLGTALSQLTTDDLSTVYDLLKARRKIKKKVEEARQKVIDTAAKGGEKLGSFAGEIRDEGAFEALIAQNRDMFVDVRERLAALEKEITRNGDAERYHDELAMLHNAFVHFGGIQFAFWTGGQISGAKRLAFPRQCRAAIDDIRRTSRHTGLSFRAFGQEVGSPAADGGLQIAQETAAGALRGILAKNWSPVTKWVSTPSTVKKIAKLPPTQDAADYLAAAKALAQSAGSSDNRHDVTQAFYTALQNMNPGAQDSVTAAATAITKAARDLDEQSA